MIDMTHVGLVVDGIIVVCLLIALALGRVIVVRLQRLREDGAELAGSIERLERAAASARSAVDALKVATHDASQAMLNLEDARNLAGELDGLVGIGGSIADRIEAAATAALPLARQLDMHADRIECATAALVGLSPICSPQQEAAA